MRLSVSQVMSASAAFSRIAAVPMRSEIAFRIARATRALATVVEDAEQQRRALLARYGAGPGQAERVPDEQLDAFLAALTPLLAEEVELSLPAFKAEDFTAIDITPGEAAALEPLLSNPEA